MKKYIGIGILCGILFLASALSAGAAPAMMGMSLALLLALSFLVTLDIRKNLYVSLEVPLSIVTSEQEFSLEIKVSLKSRWTPGKIRFLVEYRNAMSGRWDQISLTAQGIPRLESSYRYPLMITEAGCYEFRLTEMEIFDPLSLFSGKTALAGATEAMVLPEIKAVAVGLGERVRNFYADAEAYDELRPGYDPGETFGIREFRDGDRLTGVLWKMTAKTGELMVREHSLPRACPVEVYLYPYGLPSGERLERIAGLTFSLMDAGCPFYGVWQSRSRREVLRTRVGDEESFYEFLVFYMQDCAVESSGELETPYREKYRGEEGIHKLVFRDGLWFLNGERLCEEADELVLD